MQSFPTSGLRAEPVRATGVPAPTIAPVIETADVADDPLLACLEFLARHHGQPFSREGVLARLPLPPSGRLTPDLVVRAADRLGFKASVVARAASGVPGLLTPFIVLMADGGACVAVERNAAARTISVVFPAEDGAVRTIPFTALDEVALDAVIYVARDEQRLTPADDVDGTAGRHWFWSEVRRYWPSWLQVMFAAMLVNLLGLAFPLFVMSVYDRVIPNLSISTLWALTSGILIVVAFEFVLRQLRAQALDEAGRRVDMRIGAALFEHALGIAMKERRVDTGAMASQIRDFDTVRDFFTSSSIIAITDLLFVGLFIAVLYVVVGPIAIVPMIAVPIVLAVTLLAQFPLERSVRATAQQASRRHGLLIDGLAGVETVKLVGGEGILQRRWEDALAATARANTATRWWSSLALYLTAAIQQVVSIVVLVWGVFLVGEGRITVGGLIAANLLAGRVLAPLGNIAMTIARAQQAFAAMRGISEIVKLARDRPRVVSGGETVERGDIEFRNVVFSYPGAPIEALSDVSLHIRPGERVAILGKVGSGKSTIGKLMTGLYPPDKGLVLIDGAEIGRFDPADIRRAIGYVSQEAELFAGTLRDNITLGHPRASQAEIDAAIAIAGVDAFTSAHPLGLARPVGDRGRGLSGGQRQAVALARTIIRQPKVLFLDEPSSAMDANTEAELIRRIDAYCKGGRTLVLCSHRSSFLGLVDRLIVLDGGRIAADGSRDDILRRLGATTLRGPEAAP
jgi:ATP-binding cassette subfamily C protein LapB